MLIQDIIPPQKIKKIAKEQILGIRFYKNKKDKFFNIFSRVLTLGIILTVLFSWFGSPINVFGENGFSQERNEKFQQEIHEQLTQPTVSNAPVEPTIELQKQGMFHYGAKVAKNIQDAKPLQYLIEERSISFKPDALLWSNNQKEHTFIQQGADSSKARTINNSFELTGRQNKEQAKGIIYEDTFGKGINVGVLTYENLWRKILKIDSLDNLGNIPEQAEYLEIKFEMETDFEIEGWDKQGTFEIKEDTKLGDHSWLKTAKAWDSYYDVEFRDEVDENGNLVDEKTNEIPIKSEIRAKDSKMYFVKMIPIEWLKTAQFPIYTDVDIVYGTASQFESGDTRYISVAEINTNKFVVAFQDFSDVEQEKGRARVATVNGTTITWGAASAISTSNVEVSYISVAKLDTDKFVVAFGYYHFSSGTSGNARAATVSGTTITWGAQSTFEGGTTQYTSAAQLDTNKFVVAFNGKARVATVSGTTITWGAQSTFEGGTTQYASAAQLDTNKFVVAFNYDTIMEDRGKARAATVSGTTITWGAESEFASNNANYISAAQLDTDKFVVTFKDVSDSNKGNARAATVSGTTITWGAVATFEDGTASDTSCVGIDTTHFVVAYADTGDSSKGKSSYCAVSGTTITPGTPEEFESGATGGSADLGLSIALISSDKIVIAFQDDGDADKGKAIIGDTPTSYQPRPPGLSPSGGGFMMY